MERNVNHVTCFSELVRPPLCVSVTALAGATRTLRPQLRYQKKALDARINLKMELN